MPETPTGAVNGVNAVFTASGTILANHQLFVDRVLQVVGTDYDYAGATITFRAGSIPQVGAILVLYGTLPAGVGAGPTGWETAASVISDAAIELGIAMTAIDDPWASADQNIALLRALLKSQGRELAKARAWSHLRKTYGFSTVGGQTAYPLPIDFRGLVDQTGWNRSGGMPIEGPLSAQTWAYTQAVPMVAPFNVTFRPLNGQVVLAAAPGGTLSISFEYLSKYWVRSALAPAADKDAPTAKDDVICFEPLLMVRALKLAFMKARKFECGSEQQEYDETLSAVASDDSPAPVLNLAGPGDFKLIDWDNVPPTGAGG
jgi:hypothetical protein